MVVVMDSVGAQSHRGDHDRMLPSAGLKKRRKMTVPVAKMLSRGKRRLMAQWRQLHIVHSLGGNLREKTGDMRKIKVQLSLSERKTSHNIAICWHTQKNSSTDLYLK